MPKPLFDLTQWGIPELQKALDQFSDKVQGKIMRKVVRNTAKRIRDPIANATPVDSGRLAAGIRLAQIRAGKRKRGQIKIGMLLPTRDWLGIAPDDTGYYPWVLEYGSEARGLPPLRFIRQPVDNETPRQWVLMQDDLRVEVDREWTKQARAVNRASQR